MTTTGRGTYTGRPLKRWEAWLCLAGAVLVVAWVGVAFAACAMALVPVR